MPSLIESLEQLFGTTDLYQVLEITKEATQAQIRKAYHKVAKSLLASSLGFSRLLLKLLLYLKL